MGRGGRRGEPLKGRVTFAGQPPTDPTLQVPFAGANAPTAGVECHGTRTKLTDTTDCLWPTAGSGDRRLPGNQFGSCRLPLHSQGATG